MKKTLIILLFISVMGHAAHYDSYQSFYDRPVSLNFDLQYYKSDANFEADGSKTSLISGNTFQDINFASRLRWQFSELALLAGLNVGNSQSSDPLYTRKSSVLNRIDLGGEYLISSDVWYRVFGRLTYAHPLEKIDTNGDNVLTSNGASEIHPEIVFNLDFENEIYSFAKAGIMLRGEGLSTLATYGLGSEMRFEGANIGAALLGYMTAKNDSHTDDPGYRDNLNNRVNASSKMFNSINPNAHNLEFHVSFPMGKQSLFKVYAGLPVAGTNTSAGFYLGINVNWVLEFVPEYSSTPSAPTQPIFKEDTNDGVNQQYFKPVQPQPTNQDYIQQIQGTKKGLDEATKPEPAEGDDGMEVNTKRIEDLDYKLKLKKKK